MGVCVEFLFKIAEDNFKAANKILAQIQLVSAHFDQDEKGGKLPVGFALCLQQEIYDEALQATDLREKMPD